MELNSEGVWRRSVAQTDDIEITDTANFYVAGSKIVNGQPIDEFDSLKIEEYAIQNRKRPEGSAPVMSWSRDVSVTAESVKEQQSWILSILILGKGCPTNLEI